MTKNPILKHVQVGLGQALSGLYLTLYLWLTIGIATFCIMGIVEIAQAGGPDKVAIRDYPDNFFWAFLGICLGFVTGIALWIAIAAVILHKL